MSGQPEFEMTSGRSRTDHDMCIVSCAIGPHYQEPLHSTRLHCEVNVPEAWRLFYRELPLAHYHERGASLRPFGQKTKGHVSDDPRVAGHRHDEAALSAILYDMDLMPEDRGFLTLESPNGFIGHKVKLVVPGSCKCR